MNKSSQPQFIDSRTTQSDMEKFPLWGWFLPCIICYGPTRHKHIFLSNKKMRFDYNGQDIIPKTEYIGYICNICKNKINSGKVKSLKLKNNL